MAPITKFISKRSPELFAAAAELRLSLHAVQELVRQGITSGYEWNQADVRQRDATAEWRRALRRNRVSL
jgi:hypothetical protein